LSALSTLVFMTPTLSAIKYFKLKLPLSYIKAYQFSTSRISSSKTASSSSVSSLLLVGSSTFDWSGAGSYWYGRQHLENLIFSFTVTLKKFCRCWVLCHINTIKQSSQVAMSNFYCRHNYTPAETRCVTRGSLTGKCNASLPCDAHRECSDMTSQRCDSAMAVCRTLFASHSFTN